MDICSGFTHEVVNIDTKTSPRFPSLASFPAKPPADLFKCMEMEL